jgi:hypothetical protein
MTTTVSPQPELTSTSTGKASMPLTAADKTRACMGGYWFNEGVRAMRFFGGYGEPVGKLNKIGKAPGQARQAKMRSIARMLEPSQSMETTATFFSICSLFAISIFILQ